MPCFKPIDGFHKIGGGLTFSPTASNGSRLTVPCGRCIGCRVAHGKMWAIRMLHESRFHEETSFLTLTYREDQLPTGGTLVKKHTQDFWKRLRHSQRKKIGYYLCGEYGDSSLRPHYHAVCFGYRPADLQLHLQGDSHATYTSASLEAIWGHGFCTVGDVTPETCAYVARYVTKKITGPPAREHYERMSIDGEIIPVLPEFALMSRNPAIGKRHYETYGKEITDWDHVIYQGHPSPVPRYYDKLTQRQSEKLMLKIKDARTARARTKAQKKNSTPERLQVREACAKAKNKLKRGN